MMFIAAADRHARAIEFLADPFAAAREYAAEVGEAHPSYPFALGQALSTIGGLLDAAGYPVLGPDRFDCEWALTHPYEVEVSS